MFTAYHVVIMLKILPMRDRSCSGVNLWKCLKTGKNSSTTLSRSWQSFCFLCLLVSLFRERCNRWKRGLRMCINHLIWWNLWLIFVHRLKGSLSEWKHITWTVLFQNNDLANCWLSYILKVQAISIYYTLKRNKLDLLIRFCIVGHRKLKKWI